MLISAIDDKTPNINEIISDDLTTIESTINEMHEKLSKYELSKEKCDLIQIENNKENYITKRLFPYYWLMSCNL